MKLNGDTDLDNHIIFKESFLPHGHITGLLYLFSLISQAIVLN